jgi:hypothetical protein
MIRAAKGFVSLRIRPRRGGAIDRSFTSQSGPDRFPELGHVVAERPKKATLSPMAGTWIHINNSIASNDSSQPADSKRSRKSIFGRNRDRSATRLEIDAHTSGRAIAEFRPDELRQGANSGGGGSRSTEKS